MDSELSSPGPRTFQGNMPTPCDIKLCTVGESSTITANKFTFPWQKPKPAERKAASKQLM